MIRSFFEYDFSINCRNIEECSSVIEGIDNTSELFALTLYRPVEDIGNYEPLDKDTNEKYVVVRGSSRRQKRGYLNFLGSNSKKFRCPWETKKVNYFRDVGLQLLLCMHVADGSMTLYFIYEPRMSERAYREKGYHKLSENIDNILDNMESKKLELAKLGAKTIIDNSKKRFLKNKEILELQKLIEREHHPWNPRTYEKGLEEALKKKLEYLEKLPKSKELEGLKDELKKLEIRFIRLRDKRMGMQRKNMKVLRYRTVFPRILLVANYGFRAKTVSGESVKFYSINQQPSEEEMKEKKIAELLSKGTRTYPHLSELTEQTKLEVKQNLESLASWLEEQIPLIPQ